MRANHSNHSKYLVNFFSSNYTQIPLLNQREQFTSAQTIARVFYSIIFFISIGNWTTFSGATEIYPLWPVLWMNFVGVDIGTKIISVLYLLSSLLALITPSWRISRILVFVGLLEFRALANSFGKINHSGHITILICFLLIFLPYGWLSKNANKYTRVATLTIFSSCQVFFMMTYTMSGIGKLVGAFIQAFEGEIHALVPQSLPLHIANSSFNSGIRETLLGPFIMEHVYLSWGLMLGAIYLQFFSLWAAFRPALHQLWGLSLIIFHLSIRMSIGVGFDENVLWLGIFFVGSPFRPRTFSLKNILRDLPLVNLIYDQLIKFYESKRTKTKLVH